MGKKWMEDFADAGALMSGIMRVMHPDQYRMAWEMMVRLKSVRPLAALHTWPTLFNAVTIVANRQCPLHREPEGSYPWYDILVSIGSYKTAPMYLRSLGFQVLNGPGTIVGFSGKTVCHGVADAAGHRICHAFYMRESIQDFLGVRPANWMTQEVYRPWVGEKWRKNMFGMARDPFNM